MYMICKRILFTVGVFLIGCNITSKQFTAGDSFKRDDCVVFQMLRMVSNDRKAIALARSSRMWVLLTHILGCFCMSFLY